MAEKPNPKSQPSKGQPSPRRRGQVAVSRARLPQEGPAPARPARDPGTGHWAPTPAPAAPSASGHSRAPATGHRPRVPNAQDTRGEPGTASGTRPRAREPGLSTEPAPRTVRVARPTEAGLRQLGRVSKYERILQWLDGAFPSTAEVMVELEEEMEGCWENRE